MNLRRATRDDLHRVREVQPHWWGGRDLTGLLQSLFLENFASTSLIAEDVDGELLGFLIGFPSQDDPDAAYVHFIGVAPQRRGSGLGRELHDAFAARMAESGVRTVRCVTSPVNVESIAFHTRIGFVIEAQDEDLVRFARQVPAHLRPSTFTSHEDPRPEDPPWPSVAWPIDPATVLSAAGVTLRLADPADAAALFAALDHDACWAHVRGRPRSVDDVERAIREAPGLGRCMWIVESEDRVVGTTSYLEIAPVDARLEIGFTVYAPEVWATHVNPACKLLLLQWAFDHGFGRVQLKTDIRNVRSQRAIARLGATEEGVLRRYQRRQDDSVRDTVVFSVISEEWPRVREGLLARV